MSIGSIIVLQKHEITENSCFIVSGRNNFEILSQILFHLSPSLQEFNPWALLFCTCFYLIFVLNNSNSVINCMKFKIFRSTSIKMYFIPEAEMRSCNAKRNLNQNIKLVREFHNIPYSSEDGEYTHFMIFNSDLIFYVGDVWETKRIKIWKFDHSGLFQFLTDEEIPETCVSPLKFDSIPIIGFYIRESKSEIEQVKFSFRKIPGIASQIIESDDVTLNINGKENCQVLCSSNFVAMIHENLLYPDYVNFPYAIIWDINKGKENFHCVFILFEL